MKLWQKGYKLNREVEKFTVGNDYILDQRLVKYDCIISIAHVTALCDAGLITEEEKKSLIKTLDEIIKLADKGKFMIKPEEEDCHTAIDNFVIEKLGVAGEAIRIGRSRNERIIGSLRLYYVEKLGEIIHNINQLVESLKDFARKYRRVIIPGYTHMRKAMPLSISLWAKSYVESMKDNIKLLEFLSNFLNTSPLGTGAGFGIPIKLDRKLIAQHVGFRSIQKNPLYVQCSRGKFEALLLDGLTQVMMDLNRLSSDIILFSMSEFGFFKIPKELCTGSSLMPHKLNPDALEIVRSKYHAVLAASVQVKSTVSNLIAGYHRDFQVMKEAAITSIDTTIDCLKIMVLFVENLDIDRKKCEKSLTEDLFSVDKLHELVVKEKMSFKDAYRLMAEKHLKKIL
ncbi:MAG TPA: argininosuccinate lyase [Thermoplasmatales archaeon]|nr:argininosuccinate lyase [Thermoplasmatales archaeon]